MFFETTNRKKPQIEEYKVQIKRKIKAKSVVTKFRNFHTKCKMRDCLHKFYDATLADKVFRVLQKYGFLEIEWRKNTPQACDIAKNEGIAASFSNRICFQKAPHKSCYTT